MGSKNRPGRAGDPVQITVGTDGTLVGQGAVMENNALFEQAGRADRTLSGDTDPRVKYGVTAYGWAWASSIRELTPRTSRGQGLMNFSTVRPEDTARETMSVR